MGDSVSNALPPDRLERLLPVVPHLAQLVLAHGMPRIDDLHVLLLGLDLENESQELRELERWARILAAARNATDALTRDAAQRAFMLRRVPQFIALNAITVVSGNEVMPEPAAPASLPAAPASLPGVTQQAASNTRPLEDTTEFTSSATTRGTIRPTCPWCGCEFRTHRPGNVRCPSCDWEFAIDDNGQVTGGWPLTVTCPDEDCGCSFRIRRAGKVRCPECNWAFQVNKKGRVRRMITKLVCSTCSNRVVLYNSQISDGDWDCPSCGARNNEEDGDERPQDEKSGDEEAGDEVASDSTSQALSAFIKCSYCAHTFSACTQMEVQCPACNTMVSASDPS